MKSTRAPFLLAVVACGALCLALLVSLGGYFRSVESGGGGILTEKHLLSQLRAFHDRLKAADGPEDAKAALKLEEALTGFGPESDLAREMKKAYGPVLAAFAAKPREAETRYQLTKKRELMENLVNAYRKEIPRGDIRVRAAYLNVLFDTQSSLLNESDEAELVYLKRTRERLEALKSTVASGRDPGLTARVAAIDSIFQGYDRGFQQAVKWRSEKADALAKEEKALPAIAKGALAGMDSGVDETRRTFLYVCFLSLLIAGVSFLALYLGFKVLRVRAEVKAESFLSYLRSFGSEKKDPQVSAVLEALRDDNDWAPVLVEAQRAEEAFLRSCQNLLAVPRSVRSPFLVVGKDRTIRHWNDSAGVLFGLSDGKEWGVTDLLQPSLLGVKEGEAGPVLELVRAALGAVAEERFELLVKRPDGPVPYELTLSPITAGPLAGGKVLLWREVRNEAERVDKAVAAQLERIRDLVHKVTHQYETDLVPVETDGSAARAMIGDLSLLKGRVDEREILWKSEAQALNDQISRQQEILHRLAEEISRVRSGQAEALELVRSVHGGEEHLHDEVCVLERDLERWSANRERLTGDLREQSAVLERAQRFEDQLRAATDAMSSELSAYAEGLGELRAFADAAKVHSVNLSLLPDPAAREYAARARAFTHELARFAAKAEELGGKVERFLAAHPGGALAAHLRGPSLDEGLVAGIAEEQERLAASLRRWKDVGETLLSGGERAVAVLQDAEKTGAVVTQLGETSLLINEQAKGNLERWH
jgi:PAS domain-containing protein